MQDSVNAEYVFYVDVDFVPSPGLYSCLLQNLDSGVLGHKQVSILKCMVGFIAFALEAKTKERIDFNVLYFATLLFISRYIFEALLVLF